MSYILDALKKSEQERQSNNVIPSQPPMPTKRFAPELSTSHIFSIVALLTLLILVAYYFISNEPFEPDVTIEPIVVEEPKRVRPASANLVAPIEPGTKKAHGEQTDPEIANLYSRVDSLESRVKPTSRNTVRVSSPSRPSVNATAKARGVVSPEPGAIAEQPAIEATKAAPVAPKAASIPMMNSISWSVKGEIPSINYSAHIYAQDSSKGFVILNGAKKHAGDKLRNGVFVEQIEENNVVLSYKGVLFKLPAMKSWKNQ